MPTRQHVPIAVDSGQWSGGDGAKIPDGHARKLRNYVWEDVWLSRPPFTYDGLPSIRGLGIWHDDSQNARRLVAVDVAEATYAKAASGETYGASIGTSRTSRLADQVTFRGRWIGVCLNAANNVTPEGVVTYDGVTFKPGLYVVADGFPANFYPYTLAAFRDRVFFGGGYQAKEAWSESGGTVISYDASTWTRTNVTATSIPSGTSTTYRITPTATTGAELYHQDVAAGYWGDPDSLYRFYQAEFELRGVDEAYDMPVTLQLRYSRTRANATDYEVGNIIVPASSNGYRYRCTVAGTSAGAPPVYPTTVGTTVADNTVTWVCDGSNVAASLEILIPSASKSAEWTRRAVVHRTPANADTKYDHVIKFGTTAKPTVTLAPLDFGYTDGLAVTDRRKQNHGQGYRPDAFEGPPFSSEDPDDLFVVDQSDFVYWSEVLDPMNIRAQNVHRVADVPGPITAIRATGDVLAVFKRNARWVFASSEDYRYVILPVGGVRRGAGALNPKAVDVADHDGALYYVGENGVYRWDAQGEPEELCGEAMLREMFNKSTATWVESQSSPANRALLAIDQKNKRVLVYVQKGLIHCYDIRRKAWSVIDAGGDSSVTARGYQICDMIYNPNTGNVYVAFSTAATGTAGLARLDATQAAAQDQISSSGTLPVYFDIITKPIETRPRSDVTVEELRAHVECTVAGQSATAYYSRDQGSTFTASSTARNLNTSTANYEPERFSIWQGWGTITPRLLVAGKAGTGALQLSGLEATIKVNKTPEHPKR